MVSRELIAVMSSRGEQRTQEQWNTTEEDPQVGWIYKNFKARRNSRANPGNIQYQARAM